MLFLIGMQVVWTSGATNCLHTDMEADAVERLRALIRAQHSTCAENAATAAAAVSAALLGNCDAAAAQQQGKQRAIVSAFIDGSSHSNKIEAAAAAASSTDADIGAVPCSRSTSWLSPSVHVAAAAAVPADAPSSSNSSVKGSGKGGSSSGWTIIPDTPSSSFLKWAGPLVDEGVRLFADLPAWMSQ
jgi:hypothetical protein